MNFSYKIKKLQKSRNDNKIFRAWLLDEEDLNLTFYNDEIHFSTFMFRGALLLDHMKLSKSKDRVLVDVQFNKWSKRLIILIYLSFFIFYIFNISSQLIFQGTVAVLFISLLIYLFSYPILKYEVKAALLTELK
jgi:hypothetical protein